MTSLAEEQAEQRRWVPIPGRVDSRELVNIIQNEFAPREAAYGWTCDMLRALLDFAVRDVPYYRDMFGRLGVAPGEVATPEGLVSLPVMTKHDLQEHMAALQATSLPAGHRVLGLTTSSGTTGRPAKVFQSASNIRMFALLKQREFRWFRFDPAGKLAVIRLASQLPAKPDGRFYEDGETCAMSGWQYVGPLFRTGPFVAISVTNPVEAQLEWLAREHPDYLMTYPETLEHLALASEADPVAPSLRGLLAISEMLTPAMRRRIETRFAVPVHQNYGLNEVGLVAARCEAGRYHVHAEHCLVEILDGVGNPVPPGRTGRIVVTSLRNVAMPLIRYDTDDMAKVVGGPCPCGRTLPNFGEIAGRYSRIAFLPDGTLGLVGAVRVALETVPAELGRNLRKFQMHQYKDDSFELRLAVTAPLPAGFTDHIQAAWNAATAGNPHSLVIVEVSDIRRGPGGKFQDFTSDFIPAPDTGREGDGEPPESA